MCLTCHADEWLTYIKYSIKFADRPTDWRINTIQNINFFGTSWPNVGFVCFFFQGKPLTALTWGHNDKRLFVGAGCVIHVAWVTKHVATLQFLSHRCIQKVIRLEKNISKLRLPSKLKNGVRALFSPTIKVSVMLECTIGLSTSGYFLASLFLCSWQMVYKLFSPTVENDVKDFWICSLIVHAFW